ncbi:MAG TPA: response regulator, partial [Thermoanaerobaculia bacterium]|nr:response regulator [Thermoanaerobaculia bacterium]
LMLERLPMRAVVDGVGTVLRSTAEKKGVRVHVEAPADLPLLHGDPSRLKQVVYHLLANAIKFSYPDSEVWVRLRREPAAFSPLRRDSLAVAVADRGVGIDPRDRHLIFEAFRQADGTASREFQGAGLGLALVKRFVELHGGLVTVESALGQGSTFTVHLPLLQAGNGEVGGGEEPLPEPGEDQVLVVEDDPTVYEVIARHLGEGGWVPLRARTGDDALKLARHLRPVAVTLDLVLPGTDGLAVLRELRADRVTRDIPVIIISVLDNRELGLTLGADEYFVKPVDRDELLRRLAELVPREASPARVLVIDDDPSLHEMLASALPERYRLLHATTGREGVELARRERPDLVLLDLMMEGMDGFEVAAMLKGDERTRGLPIVVLTAKAMDRDDRERLHGKIEALVQKADCSPARLAAVLRDVVRRQLRAAARSTDG